MQEFRIDYQTKTIYEYSNEHKAYLFYARFDQITVGELRDIESGGGV